MHILNLSKTQGGRVTSLRALFEGLPEYSVEAQFLPGGVYWLMAYVPKNLHEREW